MEIDFDENLDEKQPLNNNSFDLDNNFDSFGGFGGEGSSPMDRNNDLLKSLTEFDSYLKTLISEWLGMVWDEDKGKYIKHPQYKAMLNITGARWCVSLLRTYVRKNNIITEVDKTTFNAIMKDVIDAVYANIGARGEEFGITSDGDMILIGNQLVHSVELILIGAGGERTYKKMLTDTTYRTENVALQQPQQQNQNQQQQKNKTWLEKARGMLV